MPSSCRPSVYGGTPDVLYHNNGDGTFTNVTKAAKIYQPKGLNLSVGAADYDNDGWPDLFVANDGLEAYLYHNQHNGTFKEIAVPSGMALTGERRHHGRDVHLARRLRQRRLSGSLHLGFPVGFRSHLAQRRQRLLRGSQRLGGNHGAHGHV